MTITKGKLTYDAEGMEGGPYHSWVLHVPGSSSGLTIGRGYDMKEKSSDKIRSDLTKAGVDARNAAMLSQASGLAGDKARQFIADHGLKEFEISMQVQETLFDATYEEIANDVKRICSKADCIKAYGPVDWDTLDDGIRDVLVDLRFRGDYTPGSRKLIQKHVSANDRQAFTEALSKRSDWINVPEDRFRRRVAYLQGT